MSQRSHDGQRFTEGRNYAGRSALGIGGHRGRPWGTDLLIWKGAIISSELAYVDDIMNSSLLSEQCCHRVPSAQQVRQISAAVLLHHVI